jgi:hypothetical protein
MHILFICIFVIGFIAIFLECLDSEGYEKMINDKYGKKQTDYKKYTKRALELQKRK